MSSPSPNSAARCASRATEGVTFVVDPGADAARRQFWPSPDGRRFLVNSRVEETTPRLLTVVLNWKEAVKGN